MVRLSVALEAVQGHQLPFTLLHIIKLYGLHSKPDCRLKIAGEVINEYGLTNLQFILLYETGINFRLRLYPMDPAGHNTAFKNIPEGIDLFDIIHSGCMHVG